MNQGGSNAKSLSLYLDDVLSKYEEKYGKRATEVTLSNRFTGIIQRAYEQSGVQIAVLVDEYDAPLQHSFKTPQHEECRSLYRDFFTGLKNYGYCIKCVFLTGITKFTQISLFSVLNTVTNISFYNDYATICGLTTEEIKENLHEEHFRFILKNLFYICGFNVNEEVQMASGRIDLVVETPHIIYVMELKMMDNGGKVAASRQLDSRNYSSAYCASHKQIVGLSLVFDKKNRGW